MLYKIINFKRQIHCHMLLVSLVCNCIRLASADSMRLMTQHHSRGAGKLFKCVVSRARLRKVCLCSICFKCNFCVLFSVGSDLILYHLVSSPARLQSRAVFSRRMRLQRQAKLSSWHLVNANAFNGCERKVAFLFRCAIDPVHKYYADIIYLLWAGDHKFKSILCYSLWQCNDIDANNQIIFRNNLGWIPYTAVGW